MKHLQLLTKSKTSKSDLQAFYLPIATAFLCALFISPAYATDAHTADKSSRIINLDPVFTHKLQISSSEDTSGQQAKTQNLLKMESKIADNDIHWLHGFSESNPTIKEESQYLYTGYKWNLADSDANQSGGHYVKLMGGLHREIKEEDNLSLQDLDATPLLIPAYGYQSDNVKTEVSLRRGTALQVDFGFIF
jgi:hypothetical protein